jgi:hypothetical protein
MRLGRALRTLIRVLLCVVAILSTTVIDPSAYASRPVSFRARPYGPYSTTKRPGKVDNARVVLSDVPNDIIPQNSNAWKCSCDSDGCWPGCFTIASASILKYWSQKGYPNLWNGDENGTLTRLRELFPNLLCYGNGDDNGKPGDSGYDAFDVAGGLRQFITEHGYAFTLTPVPEPTFEQVMAEIDAGRPVIGAFGDSPWGSHAGTIIGYDTTGGRQIMIVRPNLWQKLDTDLEWGVGYQGFGIVSVIPGGSESAVPVAPAISFEVTVNDKDTGFAAQGNWQESLGLGYGGESRAAQTTDPSNLGPTDDTAWARWAPHLPFDGMWEVLAWMPLTDSDDTVSHLATYRVTHAEGMSLARRSQHDAVQGWMSLGLFPFVQGDKASIYLGNLTGDNPPRQVWADAVKFVWRAPLILRPETEDGDLYVVNAGRRHRIPDLDTFTALRLSRSNIRKVSPMVMAQYPEDEALPSIYSSWVGQYFNNSVLSQPASVVRADGSINFRWNGAAPAANMSSLGFSSRWVRVMAFSEGQYPFDVQAVGGVRLWVDGRLEIDGWDSPNIFIDHQRAISMTSGLHRVEVEYVNREGLARVTLSNLAPNAPIVPGGSDAEAGVHWTSAPTVTLAWADGGDPDNSDRPRKYYATVWRESDNLTLNSGWITSTSWVAPLAGDGHYFWRVSTSDGVLASDWSPLRSVWVDHTPPWAQMVSAGANIEAHSTAPAEQSGALVIDASAPVAAPAASTADALSPTADAAGDGVGQVIPASKMGTPQPSIGLRLTWWATDTLSGATSFDVQAHELVHATTAYTLATEMREITKLNYELVLSGSEEITNVVVVTAVVPYTTVVPIRVFMSLTATQWVTFASGLVTTTALFLGNPGSTYEFRVRARDQVGNEQQWYDGYSVQAQVDPGAGMVNVFIPVVVR